MWGYVWGYKRGDYRFCGDVPPDVPPRWHSLIPPFGNAKPKEKPYKLGDSGGLYVIVRPNGSKLWRYKYRLGGKANSRGLGKYPDVSLKEARGTARRVPSRRRRQWREPKRPVEGHTRWHGGRHKRQLRVGCECVVRHTAPELVRGARPYRAVQAEAVRVSQDWAAVDGGCIRLLGWFISSRV